MASQNKGLIGKRYGYPRRFLYKANQCHNFIARTSDFAATNTHSGSPTTSTSAPIRT